MKKQIIAVLVAVSFLPTIANASPIPTPAQVLQMAQASVTRGEIAIVSVATPAPAQACQLFDKVEYCGNALVIRQKQQDCAAIGGLSGAFIPYIGFIVSNIASKKAGC